MGNWRVAWRFLRSRLWFIVELLSSLPQKQTMIYWFSADRSYVNASLESVIRPPASTSAWQITTLSCFCPWLHKCACKLWHKDKLDLHRSYHETGVVHIRAQWRPRGLFLQSDSCHPETSEGFRNGSFTALSAVRMEVPVLCQTPSLYRTPIHTVSTKALSNRTLVPVGGAFSLRVRCKSLANTALVTLQNKMLQKKILFLCIKHAYYLTNIIYQKHSMFNAPVLFQFMHWKNQSRFSWKCSGMHRSLICLRVFKSMYCDMQYSLRAVIN